MAKSTSTSTADTATSHAYLRIRPSDDPLPADRITGQFEQLHRALDGHPIECLLIADTDEIAYYFGAPRHTRDTLARILDRITPDSYPVETVETDPLPDIETPVAAEFHGIGERHDDWQTRLRPPTLSDAPEQHDTPRVEAAPSLPLESVIQGMAQTDSTVVYQALLAPKPDWGGEAEYRVRRIDQNRDTYGQRLFTLLFGSTEDEDERHSPRRSAHRRGDAGSVPGTRIDAILAKSSRNCFTVNARLLAAGPDADATIRDLAATFNAIGGNFYDVRATVDTDAGELHDAIKDRTHRDGSTLTNRLKRTLPVVPNNSPAIVADSTTVPHFCLFDGSSLTDTARRALRALPSERTGLTPPDSEKLTRYDHGLPIGRPRRQDGRTLETTVALPPSLQPLHTAWFGKTGSGKSTALTRAITANHQRTDGADIAVLPKGDEMATTLLRAHYAEQGDLENVYYFDCSETVPALSFFDIRDALDAGVSRTTAVQDITDHYIELLRAITGRESFDSAVRSPDVIRYLVKALFDPEHGADAFTHRDLQRAVRKFRTEGKPPLVSDTDLRGMLAGITENDTQTFDRIMQGVANRVEKVPLDDRLARVFNHVPDEKGPKFDLSEVLNEDALIILDMGGLRAASQQALTLALLSSLWTALRERARRHDAAALPLVNLYLEEAADLAVSDLLSELLAQSRSFGLAVTLAMQFPGQLREADPEAYAELMNNVSTVVTGNVAVDTQLQQRFATGDMPPEAVGNRLRALSRGEWLVSLPAPFDEPEPQPFAVESLPLPPGHPEATESFSDARESGFQTVRDAVEEQTLTTHGLAVDDGQTPEATAHEQAASSQSTDGPITSTLSFTDRFPACLDYNEAAQAIACGECGSRHASTSDGMRDAITCCASLDRVDRETIPVCDVSLQLSPAERRAREYSDSQLLFLQLVYDAQHMRFDPELEYDLCRDSMVRLREYAGVSPDAVTELVEDGLLRKDCDKPFRLYTVTAAGRDTILVDHAMGVGHGDGIGDLGESSYHRLMVLYGAQYLRETLVDEPDSKATEVRTYYQRGADRLDAVALDADGNVVATLEAERNTNDTARAVLDDFEKMAACDPTAAIWVCDSRSTAHSVLDALNDPITGAPRVKKSYSENTRPRDFVIDTAGLTDMTTLSAVMNIVEARPLTQL